MARPVITEALELLRSRCDDAPSGPWPADEIGAWSGALRGVPDSSVLEAAESYTGVFPRLSDFLVHLGNRTSAPAGPRSGPSPQVQERMALSSAARRDEAKAKLAAMRSDLAGRSKPPMPHQLEAASV